MEEMRVKVGVRTREWGASVKQGLIVLPAITEVTTQINEWMVATTLPEIIY